MIQCNTKLPSQGLLKSLQIPRLRNTAKFSTMNNQHAAAILIGNKMCSEPVVNSDRTVFKGHANCLGHAEVNAITSNPYMKPYLSCTPAGRWCFLPQKRKQREKG